MKKRWIWFGAIALAVMLLFTLLAAPSTSRLQSGSTYSRAPDGYGAWYAFMQQQGIPIKRWQKPSLPADTQPLALLRVNSQLRWLRIEPSVAEWVKKGNTLIVLGVRQPVTDAKFSTLQPSPVGSVKIETRRRLQELKGEQKQALGDRFGAIVWEEKLGQGRVILATTPHLAANAYQDQLGNYQFLAQLVTRSAVGEQGNRGELTLKNSVWVDEYIHGYKDPEVIQQEDGDLIAYLAKTPLFPVLLQAGVLLIVLVLGKNRRLGTPATLASPVVDNSEAYIQALAGVLQKAESRDFVLEAIAKEQQHQLQKALGLGTVPVEPQILVATWVQQTGRPAAELEPLLQLPAQKRPMSDQDLLTWLAKWQKINRFTHYQSPITNDQ